ncbi:hypothetical protein C4Q31_08305 [Leptospira borgpetersenii serovar Ceylonica]|uniref:Uncharacterized protein n=1 Tax=Leptospira borgpetersenii serovar Ballum TaxID=280505 RepID=A0A0S2IN62_LEPBO|nr:hypothetical protein LBBP_00765 [Leptospira borgpetersenii serovar Ballum]AXX15537.1 hypothetical protein C4Q31_08305 [Leptospira borgpetersenii serovar Ceylonica]OOV43360.1 hypothetical protein B1H38_13055 [Leptospira borgpetersenii serovar Ballum]
MERKYPFSFIIRRFLFTREKVKGFLRAHDSIPFLSRCGPEVFVLLFPRRNHLGFVVMNVSLCETSRFWNCISITSILQRD